MITIDGSRGEGGGQILRTSLALSLVTGKPFRIERIRGRRPKPGLRRQHLTAVRAAVEIGRARCSGGDLDSTELEFVPGPVEPGQYRFDVGTAGSTTLVLQTVLPALIGASGSSRLVLEGGTHNIHAPPVDFLELSFLPLIARMGPRVETRLEQHGFYPAGGGRLVVDVEPAAKLRRVELLERGKIVRRVVRGMVSRLPTHIADREVDTARRRLGWPKDCEATEAVDSPGPGNVLFVEVHSEHATEVFTGFGQRGVAAEKVAARTARQARRYLDAGVPVAEHLADQLLLPMALAGGGAFRTLALSDHATTNVESIRRFLDVEIAVEEIEPDVCRVEVVRSAADLV